MIDLKGNQRSLPQDSESQLVQDVIDGAENPLDAVLLLNEKVKFIYECIDKVRPAAAEYARQKLEELATKSDAPPILKDLAAIIGGLNDMIEDLEQERKLDNLGLSEDGIKNN